jgi:starvation-inducible DNA-binding protein
LTLLHTPEHNYSVYTKVSKIKERTEVSNGLNAIENILESFKPIIVLQSELLDLSDEANDEGINALMSDFIREQEKLVWIYSSVLNE